MCHPTFKAHNDISVKVKKQPVVQQTKPTILQLSSYHFTSLHSEFPGFLDSTELNMISLNSLQPHSYTGVTGIYLILYFISVVYLTRIVQSAELAVN